MYHVLFHKKILRSLSSGHFEVHHFHDIFQHCHDMWTFWSSTVPSPLVGHWNAATSVASGGVAPRWADCGGEPGSQQPNGLCQAITVAILNHINIYEKSERNSILGTCFVWWISGRFTSFQQFGRGCELCWFTKKFWIFRTFGEAFMSHIDQLHGNSCKSPQLWLINNDMICQNKDQLSLVFPRSSFGPSCNNAAMTSAKSWP